MSTVVSCYYRIPSKHSPTDYESWIANFMALPMKTIIFGDTDSIAYLTANYPQSSMRIYVNRPFNEFETAKYDWTQDERMDAETANGHTAKLYMIWNEKIFMMNLVANLNPYKSDVFVWCDIGCFRNSIWLSKFQTFPDPSAIDPAKLTMLQVDPFLSTDSPYPITELFRQRNSVGGTMFAGGSAILKQILSLYIDILNEATNAGIFKGKDQTMFAFLILRYPHLFHMHMPITTSSYDRWFHLHLHWSRKPLSIVLVGPGIMPIPPTGWGACEILIWDYATHLRAAGHTVRIVNTPDMAAAIMEIQSYKPDVIHIQYDDHAYIAPFVDARVVAITSHYGYLEQRSTRWGSYINTFQTMINIPKLVHFVLSPGIANVYKDAGVPKERIFIMPNGADATKFRYAPAPIYPDRSIVVGKIETRKGQHTLQHNPTVWFVGNRYGSEFDYSNPRWLGEWDKPILYDSLTNYANLVLASDGEADPLVVKEALVAGLGVVVSRYAAANLDVSQPFITVLQPNMTVDAIDAAIAENRRVSISMRDAIRAYSEQFTWNNRVKHYVNTLYSLIP